MLGSQLFRGLEPLRIERNKYFSGFADQHRRSAHWLQPNPPRSSVRHVLSAGSAAIQSLSVEFHFYKSEFSNCRIPSDVAAVYDSGYQKFSICPGAASEPDDRTRNHQGLEDQR